MTRKQHVDHWISSSNGSFSSMCALLKSNKSMDALYFGHLSIEKALKAVLAARDIRIAFVHDIIALTQKCQITLTSDMETELAGINRFNIAAKYASHKSQLFKQCTPAYTAEWIKIIRKWQKLLISLARSERAKIPNKATAHNPTKIF
jgi:HEPN domain-containing protein